MSSKNSKNEPVVVLDSPWGWERAIASIPEECVKQRRFVFIGRPERYNLVAAWHRGAGDCFYFATTAADVATKHAEIRWRMGDAMSKNTPIGYLPPKS